MSSKQQASCIVGLNKNFPNKKTNRQIKCYNDSISRMPRHKAQTRAFNLSSPFKTSALLLFSFSGDVVAFCGSAVVTQSEDTAGSNQSKIQSVPCHSQPLLCGDILPALLLWLLWFSSMIWLDTNMTSILSFLSVCLFTFLLPRITLTFGELLCFCINSRVFCSSLSRVRMCAYVHQSARGLRGRG